VNPAGKTFYLETLGCPRNEADSEAISNLLESSGFKFIKDPKIADIIIVNGCAFIRDAVSDSIDAILSLRNRNKKAILVVAGCMAQRYGEELIDAMGEIDLLVGTGSIEKIPELISIGKSEVSSNFGFLGKNLYNIPRVTPKHYRYIKIQEGCDFKCTFCLIPQLKGVSHSKELYIIKEEVLKLPESVKEIILIGQNTTSWGKDLPDKDNLTRLIEEVASIFPGWIRLLYLHPLSVSKELLKTIQGLPNVADYLDIPLQHISDSVLSHMNRGYGRREIEKLLDMITSVGDFTLRSTFIVGFPTETQKEFQELCSFVSGKKIDYAGVFSYSHEEGTHSFSMEALSGKEIMRRLEILTSLIEKKIVKKNTHLIDKSLEVIIDGIEEGEYYGRPKNSAPDIDPVVWISPGDRKIEVGSLYPCLISDFVGSDLVGEVNYIA
jgi:ribosomal protein S12 methylthiotransferase